MSPRIGLLAKAGGLVARLYISCMFSWLLIVCIVWSALSLVAPDTHLLGCACGVRVSCRIVQSFSWRPDNGEGSLIVCIEPCQRWSYSRFTHQCGVRAGVRAGPVVSYWVLLTAQGWVSGLMHHFRPRR